MFRYLSKRIKISTFSFLSIIFLFSCMSKQIVIKPLHPYQYYQNDTIIEGQKIGNDLTQYYYIENYSHDSSKIQKVEDFVFTHLPNNYKEYSQFEVLLYRKTNKINDHYRYSESDELAWYGDDRLFRFEWDKGKYTGYLEYKDGKCVNCPAVDVKMIK